MVNRYSHYFVVLIAIYSHCINVLSLHLKNHHSTILKINPTSNHISNSNTVDKMGHHFIRNIIVSSSTALISLGLIASLPMQPVVAADNDVGIVTTTTTSNSNDLTDIEQVRVLRKLQLQNKITTTTAGSINNSNDLDKSNSNPSDTDDTSYLNSLRKEQGKQQSMKKTKAQRAKDLCESLGRGC